jgi:hypothetical protein
LSLPRTMFTHDFHAHVHTWFSHSYHTSWYYQSYLFINKCTSELP